MNRTIAIALSAAVLLVAPGHRAKADKFNVSAIQWSARSIAARHYQDCVVTLLQGGDVILPASDTIIYNAMHACKDAGFLSDLQAIDASQNGTNANAVTLATLRNLFVLMHNCYGVAK